MFQSLDPILEGFILKNENVILTKDRQPGNIKERRLDWMDNEIKKAILLQPQFEESGINYNSWSLTIVSWKDEFTNLKRFSKHLLNNVEFSDIEESFSTKLDIAFNTLNNLDESDLKPAFN